MYPLEIKNKDKNKVIETNCGIPADFDSDCTDFASQVLADENAGGVPQVGQYPYDAIIDTRCWFYAHTIKICVQILGVLQKIFVNFGLD